MIQITSCPRWASLVLAIAVAGCSASGPSVPDLFDPPPEATPDVPDMDGAQIDRVEFDMRLNGERDSFNLVRVVEHDLLSNASQAYAVDMHENDFFSHTGRDGSSAGDRASAAGYEWRYISENLASGYKSEGSVINAWMDSPGHRANMLDERAQDFGIGREGDIWVLMLGAQR